jgi:hypothetical protein
MELEMINWPEMFRIEEAWAAGFWTGAASASVIAVLATVIVVIGHFI